MDFPWKNILACLLHIDKMSPVVGHSELLQEAAVRGRGGVLAGVLLTGVDSSEGCCHSVVVTTDAIKLTSNSLLDCSRK